MRKTVLRFAVVVGFALFLCLGVSAHSGKTDAQGGHYNHATGEYHFHHGFPAHQHVNGVCPYDFEDRTGESSGTDGEEKLNFTDVTGPGTSGEQSEQKVSPLASSIAFFIKNIGVFVLPFVALAFWNVYRKQKQERKQFLEEKRKYEALYSGKSMWEEAKVPNGAWFDDKGYPHRKAPGTLDEFAVFITKSGACYHRHTCPMARNGRLVNLCEAKSYGKSPCARCHPPGDLPEWVKTYQRLRWIQKKYDVGLKP